MNKKVIYTAIFGNYDTLPEPEFINEDFDYVCFTDNKFESEHWDVRQVVPLYEDPTRNARKYKILPHRFLNEYDYSLWIDGNILIQNDINELIKKYLSNCNVAMMNHDENTLDPRGCVYEEAQVILELGQKNGNYKDNPDLIINQIERYKTDNYPVNNGLAVTMEVLRRHNEKDVIEAMEFWWKELNYNSKRDQLSFNYSAWKTNLNFVWMEGDSRNNSYFLNTGKHSYKKHKKMYEPINVSYFLNMELQPGGGGKEVLLNDYYLKTVKDVVNFFKQDDNLKKVKSNLKPDNWQYFNAMLGEFRHDVGDHHEIGWENMTQEYYESLDKMSDREIKTFLEENPVEFDNGYIRHSYHRAAAMIGRLINGKRYIPFFMEKEKIYDKPRKKDGTVRIKSPVHNLNNLSEVEKMGIPRGEFTITQSGILALMGIRTNDDLDIIISSEARKQIFNNNENFMRFDNGVEIFEKNKSKFMYFNAQGDDDLIENYSFNVDGYNFLEPRFYFSRKNKVTEKDKDDWTNIKNFFEFKLYEGYPFNKINLEKWGIKYL